MDKRILKEFSTNARTELISQITLKANSFGIYQDENSEIIIGTDYVIINGNKYEPSYAEAYRKLLKEKESKGFDMLMGQIAYTWFNRFIALRFMEVNDYLPSHIRILSSETKGKVYPDILEHYDESGLYPKFDEIDNYIKLGENEKAYRKLLIAQCNELSKMLPFLFEKINDYTDMLLPENLLTPESIISKLVNNIAEEDFHEVETIGWIYQYYISDKKDEVINAKKKYEKEEIPYATQLFTPDWIVRYMVQNSLGRYWLESHPEQNELKKEWEFYLENPSLEPDFEEKLKPYVNKDLKVEDIKAFDPACGSGHILVYMFDLLYQVYEKCGYMSREIPKLIIENNLYGLDIDDRAYQLACFAVIMKGMKYNNRLLRSIEKDGIKLNIASIQETNNLYDYGDAAKETSKLDDNDIAYIVGEVSGENYDKTKTFIEQFKDAKIYGSLIKIEEFDKEFLEKRYDYICNNPVDKIEYQSSKNKQVDELFGKLIKQSEIMIKIYDVLVTNPPYMGSKYMNAELSKFINTYYKDYRADMFSAFMDYSLSKVKCNGQLGFITPFAWMFNSSYEELRNQLVQNKNISTLIQLEYNAFEAACVPVCTFTLRNRNVDISGQYIKLTNFRGSENQPLKTLEAIKNINVDYRYTSKKSSYKYIPGEPIAYWIDDETVNIFKTSKMFKSVITTRIGLVTGDANRFLKFWFEVNKDNIYFNSSNNEEASRSSKKWFPYQKGGAFRRWYGNLDYLVNWKDDGYEMKYDNTLGGRVRSHNYNAQFGFREGITWSDITIGNFAGRYVDKGYMFDSTGPMMFYDNVKLKYLFLGFCNSKVFQNLLDFYCQGFHYNCGAVSNVPFKMVDDTKLSRINFLVNDNIRISKLDWDSSETSWDFNRNKLLTNNNVAKIETAFANWTDFAEKQYEQIKMNETELNMLYIEIYGLQNEMTPKVDEKDITIRKAERERDIKSFISYAVGCILGRYSLDEEGLVFSGGEFNLLKYKTFKVDSDGIIPILAQSYFEDDIASRFTAFLKVTFGEETLNENLDFIAQTLGKKNGESSRNAIRRYFIDGFYSDHCKIYKNRPIYWLVDSGRKKGFRALIYIHRYNTETLATVRLNYLLELQSKYSNEENQINKYLENENLNVLDKKNYNKRLLNLSQMRTELLDFDKVLDEMANRKIALNLDDGVVENYKKLQGILAKIK